MFEQLAILFVEFMSALSDVWSTYETQICNCIKNANTREYLLIKFVNDVKYLGVFTMSDLQANSALMHEEIDISH